MAGPNFAEDVTYEVDRSLQAGTRKLSALLLEAAGNGSLGSSGFAMLLIEARETAAMGLIDALEPRYATAIAAKRADKAQLRALFRGALERFLDESMEWGHDKSEGAFGGGRNARLDALARDMTKRLRDRLDFVIRAAESTPQKGWHERHPVLWAMALVAFGAGLKFLFDLAARLLT